MNDTAPTIAMMPLWRRRWFRIISIIVAIFIITLTVTPLIINNGLKSWLLDNGADTVSIKNVDFNPFTGTASVFDLEVLVDNKQVLSSSLVYLDISILALFKKGIAVDAATLNKLELEIEQSADGNIRIGSLIIEPEKESDEKDIKDIKEKLAWWLRLSNVNLKDSLIRYRSPEFSGNLYLDKLSLNGLNTKNINQSARLIVDGRFNKSPIKADIKLQQLQPEFKTEGKLNLSQIKLNEFSGLTTQILDTLKGTLNSSGKLTIARSESGQLYIDYSGSSSIRNTGVSSRSFSASTDNVRYDGKISLNQKNKNKGLSITLSGELKGEAVSVNTPDNIDLQGSASWKGKLSYSEKNDSLGSSLTKSLTLGGDISINDYKIKLAEIEINAMESNWSGQLGYAELIESQDDKQTGDSTQNIQLNGQLNANKLNLNLLSENLAISQNTLSLKPRLSLSLNNELTAVSGIIKVLADGSEVHDTSNKRLLLGVSSLDIPEVSLKSLDSINIATARIKEASLLQDAGNALPAFSIANSEITDFSYQTNTVSIKKVVVDKLNGNLVRQKNGEISLNPQQKAAVGETKPSDASNNLAIIISELQVKDHSVINFTDRSVSPPFVSSLDIDSLQINNINTNKPDQALKLKLEAKLNNYAKLSVNGTVAPFLKEPAVNLKINLANQNMVALSPYFITSTGYLVRSGQMNIDATVSIRDGIIDAKNTLFMKKLRLDEADASEISKNAGHIGMPLDKALGMLRDKNDNIKLDIPIKGKLDEVDIGTGQILNTVLKKATTAGMKTYLLYAFQPYGALIIAGQAAGKLAGKIYLDPVFYQAGISDLTNEQKDYLKKLGNVMQDRPKIDVQICAHTNSTDLSIKPGQTNAEEEPALTKKQYSKSKKLGSARQKAIKDYLISEFKVKDGRLILCSPEFDKKPDAKARVELLI